MWNTITTRQIHIDRAQLCGVWAYLWLKQRRLLKAQNSQRPKLSKSRPMHGHKPTSLPWPTAHLKSLADHGHHHTPSSLFFSAFFFLTRYQNFAISSFFFLFAFYSLKMAKLTVRAENLFYLSHDASPLQSWGFESSLGHRRHLCLVPPKRRLGVRVLCSIKERQNVESNRVDGVLTGLRVVDEVDHVASSSDSEGEFGTESGSEEVGFQWNWPPWKNIPQRYKLIGTTSLAFVICNMDKVGYFGCLCFSLENSTILNFMHFQLKKVLDCKYELNQSWVLDSLQIQGLYIYIYMKLWFMV